MIHLDLFSGIGGFALAAKWAGLETIAFCEKDKFCQQVLKKHWPLITCFDDIKDLKGFPVDIITAGFPCQPFSVAGKQKGKDDDRYLWPELIRVIRESKPAWCILENVPGIIPHLDTILQDLENERYAWETFLIPASAVHAPHKRERLWIIAYRDSERRNEWFNHWKERSIQVDWERHVKTLQSEWTQYQPVSWTAFNAQEWLGFATDTNSKQCDQREIYQATESERSERSQPSRETGDVISHTDNEPVTQADSSISPERSEWNARHSDPGKHRTNSPIFNWEKDQPPIPGVDDGLPNGMDRNKSLGNAIVPQIPYLFMKMIMEIENG